ncbi:MAG: hypothetical protein FD123_961 [Bacteroidetes bacterium]|nr:MAG: hypothetical protein FD123_961 [Bacteroidota bacterium]
MDHSFHPVLADVPSDTPVMLSGVFVLLAVAAVGVVLLVVFLKKRKKK